MGEILYVYAIGRGGHSLPHVAEAIDGSERLTEVSAGGLVAFATPVDDVDFSQGVIDARAADVEWLGALGYRHQNVMAALMRGGTIIPLRAFTLFRSADSLRNYLDEGRDAFSKLLERVDGKQEWTLRIELDADRWNEALVRRVESLRTLSEEAARASAGKAFLLRKKIDDERKRASREAEEALVAEIESEIVKTLACDTVSESRTQRGGAFPQINVLIDRDEEARLQGLRDELNARYDGEGVDLALTGPWPPYSFVGRMGDE
jgi:hypothetical protein